MTDYLDPAVFVEYLAKTRWFGGKGRPFTVSGVTRIGALGEGDPAVDVLLVELTYSDVAAGTAAATELYQVPLAYYTEPEHRLDHAFVGWWDDPERGWVHAYDAVHDRAATALWLEAFGGAAEESDGVLARGGLGFHRLPDAEVDTDAVASLFSGEQSNSSILFGEDSVLKLFRKISAGPNPDVTTHDVLTRAGSTHVAHLYGWVEQPAESADGLPTHLGMLQQFLRTASDGWDLALASVRHLLAEPIVPVEESGGDFAAESARLGEALREVHEMLRAHLPSDPAISLTPAAVAAAMEARLDAAVAVVPQLTAHADRLRDTYARLAALPSLTVQQVHGDLHLGQTLRTALGWKIVDFEGEPAKTLTERLLPDSPWRDVAGMLRSFDYAPHAVRHQQSQQVENDETLAATWRASGADWAARNQAAFLAAYAGGETTAEQDTLVEAYLADKAVYETVYEARNRPTWLEIPLAAVAKIGA